MKRNQSPCIGICKFTGVNHWCLGCGRTIEECREWKTMKPFGKKRLVKDLPKRMLILNENS